MPSYLGKPICFNEANGVVIWENPDGRTFPISREYTKELIYSLEQVRIAKRNL